jgi:hypothetical protein
MLRVVGCCSMWKRTLGTQGRAYPGRPMLLTCVPCTTGLAFGGGPYRCPGRFFAELELCLIPQLILARAPMKLLSPSERVKHVQQQQQSAGAGGDAGLLGALGLLGSGGQQGQGLQDQVAALATQLMRPEAAFWSFGAGKPPAHSRTGPDDSHLAAAASSQGAGGADQPVTPAGQQATSKGSAAASGNSAAGTSSVTCSTGLLCDDECDPDGLLPPCDMKRLVGVKVPSSPCWVTVA